MFGYMIIRARWVFKFKFLPKNFCADGLMIAKELVVMDRLSTPPLERRHLVPLTIMSTLVVLPTPVLFSRLGGVMMISITNCIV